MTTGPARTPPRGDGGLAAVSAIGAYEAFVGANFGRLLQAAYTLTRDPALAEDLVQVTFAEVRSAWPWIRRDPDPYVRKVMLSAYSARQTAPPN